MRQPTHGTVRMIGNEVLYIPKSDFCGFDEFTYAIYSADDSCSAPATVGVDVRCGTEPEQGIPTDSPSKKPTSEPTVSEVIPVANNDNVVVEQGKSVVIFVLANDVIPKGKLSCSSHGTCFFGAYNLHRDSQMPPVDSACRRMER